MILKILVIVEKLYNKLHYLFLQELYDLHSGLEFNSVRIKKITDLMNAINYISFVDLSQKEITKISNQYEYI